MAEKACPWTVVIILCGCLNIKTTRRFLVQILHPEVLFSSSKILLQYLPNLFFRNMEDPTHFTTPSAMIAIRSPNKSASSMKWVDKIIVLDARSCCNRFQICLLASGSNPDVGSSRITICWLKQEISSHSKSVRKQSHFANFPVFSLVFLTGVSASIWNVIYHLILHRKLYK